MFLVEKDLEASVCEQQKILVIINEIELDRTYLSVVEFLSLSSYQKN